MYTQDINELTISGHVDEAPQAGRRHGRHCGLATTPGSRGLGR
jgi:hypothetical protein